MPLLKRRYLLGAIIAAVFLALVLLVWRLCNPPALYRMTILPPNTRVLRLNDRGQVLGQIDENGHLFLWDRADGMQDLGFSCPWNAMTNNAGQIVGTMRTDPNNDEAFLWEPDKGVTMLGTLGGKISHAYAMNNRGQVVGVSLDANDCLHTFLWDKETGMKKLLIPDGSRCLPLSINDAGQVLVMAIKPPQTWPGSWYLLDSNGSKPVAPLPPDTWLQSMNANLCMVAIEGSRRSKPYLFFRNQHGELRRLFPFFAEFERATRLNDKNQIACTLQTNRPWESLRTRFFRRLRFFRWRPPSIERESYLWDPVRGRISLGRCLKGVDGFSVEDLNNNGCIIGMGNREDGSVCSVLLEPIPERWGK
jgi:probable HAF family extracellular repeat protein